MAEAVRTAARDFPEKRIFAHFVQPHYPFIGASTRADKGHLGPESPDRPNVWNAIVEGRLTTETPSEVVAAYEANLDPALATVEPLLEDLDGRTVVTSDHGNMLGERARPVPVREWGHPRGIYTPELVEVPWQIADGERRPIVAEAPSETTHGTTADVDDRLSALGYR